jgi:hypothetical protein
VRTSTVIALATQIPYRVQPLVGLASEAGAEATGQETRAKSP